MCTRAPASRASSASRATIDSSAARGQPASPRRAAVGPSCATDPRSVAAPPRAARSGPPATPSIRAPSHDQRIRDAVAVVGEHLHLADTGGHRRHLGELAALEADRDCADRVHVDEAHFLAAAPHVIGDDGRVGDRAGVRHREHGGVPARAAAAETVVDGLGSSRPGSRRCVCMSTKPGSRIWPAPSMTSTSSPASRPVPISRICPPPSSRSVGSPSPYTRTFRINTFPLADICGATFSFLVSSYLSCSGRSRDLFRSHQQPEQHRHTNVDAVRDLLQHSRSRRVGDRRRDLHAAQHRAGVQHHGA